MDDDERTEELSSISAIYPELLVDPANPYHATLDLDVVPAEPFRVRFHAPRQPYAQATAHTEPLSVHTLTYLPPLRLDLTLPAGYPDHKPPIASISTRHDWLSPLFLCKCRDRLEELWEEYGHSQVVFAYIDYLQSESEQLFGLASPRLDGQPHLFDGSVKDMLLAYNHQKIKDEFAKGSYSCGICLDPKPGSACHKMHACAHVFCVSCLQDFYNNAIQEGDVASVKCLDPDCGMDGLTVGQRRAVHRKTLHPRELLDIPLERIQVDRFVNLKLKKKVESDKNTVYCPRQWCQAPARSAKYAKFHTKDLEAYPDDDSDDELKVSETSPAGDASAEEDRLAVCSGCAYAFCRRCRRLWHGDHIACRTRRDSQQELSPEEKASEEWIRKYTSPCPSCDAPCQKRMGCNHMTCFRCATHFCYLCSAWLHPGDPYKHFNAKGQPCFQRLWDLEEGDLGDEARPEQRVEFGGARGFENEHAGAVAPRPLAPAPADLAARDEQDEHPAPAHHREQIAALFHDDDDGERIARGLQRFLQMAQDDEEDGWDSDDLEDDIQRQLALLEQQGH